MQKFFCSKVYFFLKQPSRGVPRKRCSENCSKFTGEHPSWSVISIKLQSNFIEITLRHGCSLLNLLHIFRIPFLKNTSGWLLLFFYRLTHTTETWIGKHGLKPCVSSEMDMTLTTEEILNTITNCNFLNKISPRKVDSKLSILVRPRL